MLRNAQRATLSSLRVYSTSQSTQPSLKLVAELRKRTEVSITKAREALSATNNDVTSALDWLQKDLVISGAKKAAKFEGRLAREGLVSLSVLSQGWGQRGGMGNLRAAMVELNCETDFVGRNELFGRLAADIAHTAAFISDPPPRLVDSAPLLQPCPLEMLYNAPLLSQIDPQTRPLSTVCSSIRDLMAKVGEKISLRRAITVQNPLPQINLGLRLGSYAHGSIHLPSQGRIGAITLLALRSPHLTTLLSSDAFREDLERLQRSLSRQIVGFDTRSIRSPPGTKEETALYEQPFMMLAGGASADSVEIVLQNWGKEKGLLGVGDKDAGVRVIEFAKWTVGDNLDTQ